MYQEQNMIEPENIESTDYMNQSTIGQSNEYQECRYKNQIIELKTDSLDKEIRISKIIQNKLQDTKYESNFSYIIKTEPININEITETDEITKCNLSREPTSEYILCEYTNRPSLRIMEYINKKIDSKQIINILFDFHITLQEALIDLYNKTNIIHNSINENNIIISEEQLPIIKDFKQATDEETLANNTDIHSLAKTFLLIINNISITDERINKYRESLEK